MSTDMRSAIEPKSSQLNADDLISGPRTITITGVKVSPGVEQPVAVSFEDDNGKPYLPCKSMARVLVALWGPDAKEYTGRSLTLYRDPTVTWAGLQVGGIRISHMSDIKGDQTMALTVTRQSRKPFTVKPLMLDSRLPPTGKGDRFYREKPAQGAPPPAERPAESAIAPTEPEATRAAGQAAKARDRFLTALAKCKTLGDTAELDVKLGASAALLGAFYLECAAAMQAKVDELKGPADEDIHDALARLDEWPPAEGRDEDERQGDLIG